MESVFLTYIRMVLKKWTGLQLAIMEGMAGCYGREKEIWFGDEIEKFFKNNKDLAQYEVEDFIASILDSEFDTIAEDGSIEEVAKQFCQAFELCSNGSECEVQKLLPAVETTSASPSVAMSKAAGDDDDDDEQVVEPSMPKVENLTMNEKMPDEEELSDGGWTKVRSGRKRK